MIFVANDPFILSFAREINFVGPIDLVGAHKLLIIIKRPINELKGQYKSDKPQKKIRWSIQSKVWVEDHSPLKEYIYILLEVPYCLGIKEIDHL